MGRVRFRGRDEVMFLDNNVDPGFANMSYLAKPQLNLRFLFSLGNQHVLEMSCQLAST